MLIDSTQPQLADLHADALALGWQRRARLLDSAVRTFRDLLAADQRLARHQQALLLLGQAGRARLQSCLEEALTRGELFALACHALACQDEELTEASLALAQSMPHLQAPLLAAIEWQEQLPGDIWLDRLPSAIRLQALASGAWRFRGDPDRLGAIYASLRKLEPTPEHIVAGLRLVCCVGDAHMARAAEHHLDHARPEVRLAAAQTLLSLGEPEAAGPAIETLRQLVGDDAAADRQAQAMRTLALHAPVQALGALVRLDAASPSASRLFLLAQGWIGRVDAIPLLCDRLGDPAGGRLAAAAITLITGSEPQVDGWSAAAPAREAPPTDAAGDSLATADPDNELPWPSREGFAQWWARHGARFDPQQTYLYGQPVAPPALARILRHAPLAGRQLAAERLQRLTRGPLFQTQLPAMRQRQLFSRLD